MVFARRASSGDEYARTVQYEMMFKRPKDDAPQGFRKRRRRSAEIHRLTPGLPPLSLFFKVVGQRLDEFADNEPGPKKSA